MKLVLGVLLGWLIGSKVLDSDYRDVTDALREVARSDELRDVVTAVRLHATQTLRDLADLVEPGPGDDDLVSSVTDLQSRRAH